MLESENPTEVQSNTGPTSYTCPGELYSISRGIHLSRLAAFYSKCRDCQHRQDLGSLNRLDTDQPPESTVRPTTRTIVSDESIRGVYLNELDRNRAIAWGESLAGYLWDQQPMMAPKRQQDYSQIIAKAELPVVFEGPTVVVGFDERPSSPDIVTGAVQGLRRMGCPVVDLAQTSLPAVAFGVHSHSASAGLFVTGAGCDPSQTGFEFMDRTGRPFPRDVLERLERTVKEGIGRQSRQIGDHRPKQLFLNYVDSLEPSFHALRPLKIVCGSSTRMMPRVLDRLFASLPCALVHLALPTRRRNLFDGRDADLQKVASAVMEGKCHLGVVFDEDSRRVAFVTDSGRLASSREIARMVIEIALRQHQAPEFFVASSWLIETNRWLTGRKAKVLDGGESVADLVRKLQDQKGVLALSADGRIWFLNPNQVCDALLVFAYVLQALSLSDAAFSEIIERMGRDE